MEEEEGCVLGEAFIRGFCPGIRVLDGPLTDSLEAVAFNKHYQVNDIYSCRFLAPLPCVCARSWCLFSY